MINPDILGDLLSRIYKILTFLLETGYPDIPRKIQQFIIRIGRLHDVYTYSRCLITTNCGNLRIAFRHCPDLTVLTYRRDSFIAAVPRNPDRSIFRYSHCSHLLRGAGLHGDTRRIHQQFADLFLCRRLYFTAFGKRRKQRSFFRHFLCFKFLLLHIVNRLRLLCTIFFRQCIVLHFLLLHILSVGCIILASFHRNFFRIVRGHIILPG